MAENEPTYPGITFEIQNQLVTYVKILLLLYADDTVIIADNAESLQNSLDKFSEYCKTWKLDINISKTKVMIFGSTKKNFSFRVNGSEIEIVDSYKYLGTTFSRSGSFLNARKAIAQQAQKALHLLYSRISSLQLPIDLQLRLFDCTVLPIMTYACEVWGHENLQILERIHLSFLKRSLKLKKSTPSFMVYAETGRYPIDITVKSRMISFWEKIVTGKEQKLTKQIYTVMITNQNFRSKWLNAIKTILSEIGRPDIWDLQSNLPIKNLGKLTKTILLDQFHQSWCGSVQQSTKGLNYYAFKDNLSLEKYLLTLNRSLSTYLLKFRTGNHRLPVETGRWNSVEYYDRKCTLCNRNDTGDEFHYLLVCDHFAADRVLHIKRYFYSHPNMYKFKELMCSTSENVLIKLARFCKIIMNTF